MASTRDLRIRLSAKQHERLKEKIKLRGGTISQYIRNLILEHDDSNIVNKFLEMKSMIMDIHKKICLERK